MSDAARQQLIAGLLAIILVTAIAILAVSGKDVPPTIEGLSTLLVGFLIGNVKTNGLTGSKATEANENLAAKVADKVVEKTGGGTP